MSDFVSSTIFLAGCGECRKIQLGQLTLHDTTGPSPGRPKARHGKAECCTLPRPLLSSRKQLKYHDGLAQTNPDKPRLAAAPFHSYTHPPHGAGADRASPISPSWCFFFLRLPFVPRDHFPKNCPSPSDRPTDRVLPPVTDNPSYNNRSYHRRSASISSLTDLVAHAPWPVPLSFLSPHLRFSSSGPDSLSLNPVVAATLCRRVSNQALQPLLRQ